MGPEMKKGSHVALLYLSGPNGVRKAVADAQNSGPQMEPAVLRRQT